MVLEEKVAIVTGGSRGIGRAVAIELAKCGCKVVINYLGNEKLAQEVVAEIIAAGGRAIAVRANVANLSEVEEMIKQVVDTYGRIDILINNAGITRDTLLMRMKEEQWDEVIDINLKGTYNCCKSVLKLMMKQKSGKIVNVASVVGVMGNAGQVNYAASKAGIIGLTKSLAKEVASRNISVNAIAPGFITTDMTGELSDTQSEALLQHIPLGRFGKPEEIASVVRFLVSDDAAYITGQTINLDGGMVMS